MGWSSRRGGGPLKNGDGIGLVVVRRGVAKGAHRLNHLPLTGVAAADDAPLPGTDWNAMVRDVVVLAERAKVSQEAAVDVGSIDAAMAPHLLEHNHVKHWALVRSRPSGQLVKPALEAQEPHPGAFVARGVEGLGSAARHPVAITQCPAGLGAEVQGQQPAVSGPRRELGRLGC